MSRQNDESIHTLNSFLRGERSAVATYKKALAHVKEERIRRELEALERDHEARVEAISAKVRSLGGEPAEGSGVWGAFASLVQTGADALGDKAAVQALEQGEDHGLADYKRDMKQLHGEALNFARLQLLAAQQASHDRCSKLKKTLH